jgi:hypothetical protein
MAGVSNYCSQCIVQWSPYMCDKGCCPGCGGGTVRKQEPADPDIAARWEFVLEGRKRRAAHEAFDEFYIEREVTALLRAVDEMLGDAPDGPREWKDAA